MASSSTQPGEKGVAQALPFPLAYLILYIIISLVIILCISRGIYRKVKNWWLNNRVKVENDIQMQDFTF